MAASLPSSNERYSSSPLRVNVEKEERTFTVQKGDLEHGEVDMIEDTFQNLLNCVNFEANRTNRFSPSIYMAPGTLRDVSPSCFNPRIVSIGPLHREDKNVQAFEKQKIIHVTNLLQRTKSTLEETLKSCVQNVYSSMDQIKAEYVWTKTYNDSEIAKMMVMDGCFILEFIYSLWNPVRNGNLLKDGNIIYDLVLLENQIPFFIIEMIFECTILKNEPYISIVQFIYPLLNHLSLFRTDIKTDNIFIDDTRHILSLLHECYKPHNSTISKSFPPLYSAVDLHRAGVNFKPNQDPTWEMQMEVKIPRFPCFFGLWSKPTLRMPILSVHDSTELLLRNLIAYEHSGLTRRYITSYAYVMDMLVNTKEDVARLVEEKVLVNILGSNDEAANMINNICKQVTFEDFFYNEQCNALDKYCNGYWPKHIARLRRTYFSSPWNVIALVAGIILFTLTVVQTIFTIKSSGNK